MPERDLPPEEERLDLREAATVLGKSLKAAQQMVARGTLDYARQIEPGALRARRVVTTRAWIEDTSRAEGKSRRGQRRSGTPQWLSPTSWRRRRPA